MSRCARRRRTMASAKRQSKVSVKGEVEHTAAEGDGPVNALDNALRAALVKFYPSIKDVKIDGLQSPHPRVPDRQPPPKTRVLIESTDGKNEWGTVGVSDNIIDASWHALVDKHRIQVVSRSEEVVAFPNSATTPRRHGNFMKHRRLIPKCISDSLVCCFRV